MFAFYFSLFVYLPKKKRKKIIAFTHIHTYICFETYIVFYNCRVKKIFVCVGLFSSPFTFLPVSESDTKLVHVPANDFACKMHQCQNCNKSYRHSFNLSRHLNYECGIEPKFPCPHCPYRAKLKGNLKKHLMAKHQYGRSLIDM